MSVNPFDATKTGKKLKELIEIMPEPFDKKYEYIDINGLKQIRLYEFLPNLRGWKAKLIKLKEEIENGSSF